MDDSSPFGRAWSFYISEKGDASNICGMREFSGSHHSDALYQGMPLVGY